MFLFLYFIVIFMFEGLSHGSQSYCNRAILSTKLINAGLYVFCKVNDNGTTAKPAGCGWLLTFTEQTHVNVLKCRNQCLQTLWPAFPYLWHPSFADCLQVAYLLPTSARPCLLYSGTGAWPAWCLVCSDFKTMNLVHSSHSHTSPWQINPRTQGHEHRLMLRRVRWGHVALFKQPVNNLRRIAEHFIWQGKEIGLSCQVAQI